MHWRVLMMAQNLCHMHMQINKYINVTNQWVLYCTVNMLAAVHHLSLSWQAEHEGNDIHIRHVCAVSHCIIYKEHVHMGKRQLSYMYGNYRFLHTLQHQIQLRLIILLLLLVHALLWQPPPTILSGRKQWAFVLSWVWRHVDLCCIQPRRQDACCSAGLGLGLSHAQTPFT